MTEETKQSLAAKELDNKSKQQEKTSVEPKSFKESPEHFQNVSLEPQAVNSLAKFAEKERDNTQQREAIIRPQQAGKIDFKSLQNRNRTWPGGKDPQSPSGKSRNRDRSRKSGKGERGNPQQLYRLSITNPRSNPTIGIAYPQQKVSPVKKLESSRGPVSDSHRFQVPSIPEREAQLQQEELHFKCFQEDSPNLSSQSYTSKSVGSTSGEAAHQNPPSTAQQHKPSPIENNSPSPGEENLFPDFQLRETETWQSPERTFKNTNFAIISQKPNNLVGLYKANSFMPLSFQYTYPLIDESASDSFSCNQNTQSQDYTDISFNTNQVSHNSFSFQSPVQGHVIMQASTQFVSDQVEDRQSYPSHAKPPQYMPTAHGVSPVPTNAESLVSSTGQSEQSKSIPAKFDTTDTGHAVGSKSGYHHKNGTTSRSVFIQGSAHHIRNSSSQIHVISPPHNGIHVGSGSLDKSVSKRHSGVSHTWEGPDKAFPPPLMDNTSVPYPYQYQPSPKQRQNTGINGRMPWQQICFTTAIPNQNRIDISRQLTNQHNFLISPSDLQDNSEPHINNFLNKKTTEAFSNKRQDGGKQGCNTITSSYFANNVEINPDQLGDAKNNSIYFGINHSVPVTSSRNSIYPPLHVAPVGLRIASPYDSPSHSPTQNPTSNSTCSSLSPASTSSLSSNPDDSQTSKVLPPQFYQQQQDKALISSSNLSNSQNNLEVSRGLHYKQESAKENILNFIPNNRDSKLNMESGKNCLDTYRTERNPPPPYSTHQLLQQNLDQLDVVLTCKQCDQNFNNLASFLDHKLYCGQHTFAQNDLKDVPEMEDGGKIQADHTKAMSSGSSFEILRSSSDLHLSLLGLYKNGEIVSDNETKGDVKNDPIKLMLPSAHLPDLEMEDAKLDSLITEALNGLGYQSDNAEIDSSFIDAFVDDDLSTTKSTSTRQALTTKDSTAFEGRINNELTPKANDKYPFDSGLDSSYSGSTNSPLEEHQHESMQNEEGLQTVTSPKEPMSKECSKQIEWENNEQENDCASKFLLSSTFSARCGLKSLQSSTALVKSMCPRSTSVTTSPTAHKPIATEGKRKRSAGESWSKELIHKIVQQKNKLHKLQVKAAKNMQFSLVMERVTPAVQTSTLQEYDYVSDSDEDGEPVKIASQGRLSQSIRCKYTYTKECKGRIREARKALDTSPSIIKKSPSHQSLCRRSSRSSTSSELSTSISICTDNINSPKSVDYTDSDSEKRMKVQNDQDNLELNGYEDSPPRIGESSTSLALTFMKNTKRYSTDKILLTEHKDSFTTSRCSSIICKTEESASEGTMTKSTVSLARFKTTKVKIEENVDHYGFETGVLGTTEEPFKKDYSKNITSPRGTAKTFNPIETTNNIESSHVFTLKKDVVKSKGKSHKSRTNSSESPGAIFEKSNSDASSSEETKKSSTDPFSNEPLTPCTSLMNNVCLSPSKIHDSSPQKDRQCPMSYTSDHDQSPIKSPLSFDTTSMFGDLTVGGFENNLYPDIQLAKESFSPSETTAEKKGLFESSFSPFLEHRDWNLMVDVTAELPDEISQYKDDSDSNESKDNFNHVSFSLPEKILDYSSNLNSSVSADDLEIKRIVTELESQLQMAKLSCPSPLDSELRKQLTMSKFSPLRLNPESEDEDSSLEINCTSEILPTATPVDSQSALFSEPDLSWTSPLQFGLMCRQQGLHIPTHSSAINTSADSGHDHMDLKDSTENHSSLHREDKTEKNKFLDLSTSKSEEMLEHEMYTEDLMKSLEVISDSLSSGFTSPHSSPSQECEVLEDHDKPESEHSDRSDDCDKVESRTLETERRHVSPHNEKFVGNEHNDCESLINQTEKAENNMRTDVKDSMHITQILHFSKTSKAENIMCAEEGHNYGEESVIVLEPDKRNEHLSDITGGTVDNPCNMDVHPPSIKSPFSEDFKSTHSQPSEICEINSQQLSPPKDLSVVKDDHDCSDSVQRAMPDITLFPSQLECEEIQQKSPGLVTVTHSLQSPSDLRVNSTHQGGLNNLSTVTPELSENRTSLEDKNTEDINTGTSVDTFDSPATELNNPFIPHLDLVEVTKSKMSSHGTLLAVDSISKQPLDEISKPSETLDGSQDKGTLYDLKLSPLNYSEYNVTFKCLNKGDDQSNIKSSSTDSFILNSCALSLSSSPSQNAASLVGLDIPDISLNDNISHNDIKYSGILDTQMIPNEHNVLLRSTVLDKDTKTKSSDVTCPSFQNEGQCLKPSETKALPIKVDTQNAVQGKFQCEICAMFFCTLPGLKRHKAMKHVVKTEGISPIENVNMNNQVSNPTEKEASPENEKAHNTSKNNNMDISSELFSPKLKKQDPFSDEILGVLKTDVLQAISPNSPSMEVKVSEEQKDKETTFTKHPVLYKKGAAYDVDVTTCCDINVKHENFCSPREDSHILTGLKAVSDDESSFSQLFPRNNDRKRKKCARVYGKSNKKQKQLSCYPPANVFTDKCEESKENKIFNNDTKDLCEYETISINNSSVQSSTENVCHSNDDLIDHQGVCEKNVETGITGFLCETEDTSRQPTMHQEESQGVVLENTMSSIAQADCKPDVSTTACCHPPSIEIPNPNATIEVPVSLFEPGRDKTSVQPIASTELMDPVTPGKKSIEQKCRKRIEPGLKTKDKQYKCKVCFTWFLTLGELDFHKLSHNPSPPPTCYMCVQRKFSSREQLRDHLREKHAKNKVGVWTCGMCLKEISDVWMYNEHLREHATQFARRGQSQSSLLDVPGCFMQENAVRNFISSIMQHRPSRPAKGDNVKQPSKEEKNISLSVNGQETQIKDEFDSTAPRGGAKHGTLTTLEVLPEAEISSKNVKMHPNCKDPSRDCHHCGKQFPKPFKLQRHLVVHSLQKIFLCHKCPLSYQEAKELKDHLKNEHKDKDEPDSKHTTLYNCELCANVMHVIKKSFICSTCNYTFSKKEQFDRHMEKHLAGGNKIFKFRGVARPCKPFDLKDDKSDMPPSKKRKATENSLDNSNVDTVSFNLNKSTNIQGMKSVLPIIDDTLQKSTNEHSTETNTSVKTEDEAEDILKVTQCLVQKDSTEPNLSTTKLKEEDTNFSLSQECECGEVNTVDKGGLTEICDVKIEGDCATMLLVSENHINENHTSNDTVEKNPPVNLKNATEQTETKDSDPGTTPVCSQTNIILPNQDIQELSSVKQPSCETTQLKQEQTIKESFSIKGNKKKQDVHTPSPNEQPAIGLDKHITAVSSEDNLKQSDPRCVSTTDAALSQSPHANFNPNSTTSADSSRQQKVSTRQQRKRKDLRTLSPTARENLGIDLRVKKFRTNRCENNDGLRKTDLPNDYPVLASVKDDTSSNKNIYKNKTGSSNLGLQLKKGPVDSFSPKKMEVVHFSRDCKGKKNIPGRPPHSTFRMSTLNNPRPKPVVQTKETYTYHTAESQNNLLSQLFGQRLTSFKIPLRKDTSESVT